MAKRFKVNIPNIPAVYNDELGPEHRAWLKVQHPADYAYLLHVEKEHEKAEEAQSAPTPANAPAKAEDNKPADKGEGGKK